MSDLKSLVPLASVSSLLPRPVHVNTIRRWADAGVGGRRLPTHRVGGRLYVDPTELRQFVKSEPAQ